MAEGFVREDQVHGTSMGRCVLAGEQHHPSNSSSSSLSLLFNKQGTHIYRYRPRNPTGREQDKEVSCSPTQEKPSGATKFRGDGAEPKKTIAGSQPYWQSKAFGPSKPTQPGHLSPSNTRASSKRLTSLPESQKTTEEMRTPLGIPLSKLSQSKHLKNRVTGAPGASIDSKKKPPETTSQKDH